MGESDAREDLDSIALHIVGKFAFMQADAVEAMEAYLSSRLAAPVHRLIWRRAKRMSDDDICDAVVGISSALGRRLHERAFVETFRFVKEVRDTIAHVGTLIPGRDPESGESVLLSLGDRSRNFDVFSRERLDSTAFAADWLASVAIHLRFAVTGETCPANWHEPSDVPRGAFVDWAVSLDGWPPDAPHCPNGHVRTEAADTTYGRAWVCTHCGHARLID